MNIVVIDGLLGKDAEVHTFENGIKLATFNIAHTDSYKKDNEWVKQTSWIKCKKFNPTDYQIDNLKKGTPLTLSGRLKEENWEKDGKKRSQIVLMVEGITYGRKYEKSESVPEVETAVNSDGGSDDLPF